MRHRTGHTADMTQRDIQGTMVADQIHDGEPQCFELHLSKKTRAIVNLK